MLVTALHRRKHYETGCPFGCEDLPDPGSPPGDNYTEDFCKDGGSNHACNLVEHNSSITSGRWAVSANPNHGNEWGFWNDDPAPSSSVKDGIIATLPGSYDRNQITNDQYITALAKFRVRTDHTGDSPAVINLYLLDSSNNNGYLIHWNVVAGASVIYKITNWALTSITISYNAPGLGDLHDNDEGTGNWYMRLRVRRATSGLLRFDVYPMDSNDNLGTRSFLTDGNNNQRTIFDKIVWSLSLIHI